MLISRIGGFIFFLLIVSKANTCFAQSLDSSSLALKLDSLINLTEKYGRSGEFLEAQKVNLQAEKFYMSKMGEPTYQFAKILQQRGTIYSALADYSNSAKWYKEALHTFETTVGTNNADFAYTARYLAISYFQMGDYESAEPCLESGAKAFKYTFGEESQEYADIQNLVGISKFYQARFMEALDHYLNCKTIYEKALGKSHAGYANVLNNISNVYEQVGDFNQALIYRKEVVELYEAIHGQSHEKYAMSLGQLAGLYRTIGAFDKALQLYDKASEILEKTLGSDHHNYLMMRVHRGTVYMDMGDYAEAEKLYLESIDGIEKRFGKRHPGYSISLRNLCTVYQNMGMFDLAEKYCLKGLEVDREFLGTNHPDYARTLELLGTIYKNTGQYEKAEELYLQALKSVESIYGRTSQKYAGLLVYLGSLYTHMQYYDTADSILSAGKELIRNSWGEKDWLYGTTLRNQGTLYKQMGNFKLAESAYLEYLQLLDEQVGNSHREYARMTGFLADLYVRFEEKEKAKSFLIKSFELDKKLIQNTQYHLSESEMNQFMRSFRMFKDLYFSFTVQQDPDDYEMAVLCYNSLLFYKGYLQYSLAQINRLSFRNPDFQKIIESRQILTDSLAREYAKSAHARDVELIKKIENQINTTEKELNRAIPELELLTKTVDWKDIQQNLQHDEMAIEFAEHWIEKDGKFSKMHSAILVKPGMEAPALLPLIFNPEYESPHDFSLNNQIVYADHPNSGNVRGGKVLETSGSSQFQFSYNLLVPYLNGVKTLYYSPDGVAHQMNLGAISIKEGSHLSDRFHMVRLNSTRQLAVESRKGWAGKDALVIGGVRYELDSTLMKDEAVKLGNVIEPSRLNYQELYTKNYQRGSDWTYLPYTEKEAIDISSILVNAGYESTLKLGYAALEENLKKFRGSNVSPRILHLATHGFFNPNSSDSSNQESGGLIREDYVFRSEDNPMFRSGLLLAGANQVWSGQNQIEGIEDGILTAYEIAQMNLDNTELVVLSACETGLGDIQESEGVYGLQRAFKIAGAKYILMSLWQVRDMETMDFMVTFYENWLEKDMDIPVAFRSAQKKMRDRYQDPYLWAGFILIE